MKREKGKDKKREEEAKDIEGGTGACPVLPLLHNI